MIIATRWILFQSVVDLYLNVNVLVSKFTTLGGELTPNTKHENQKCFRITVNYLFPICTSKIEVLDVLECFCVDWHFGQLE